MYTTDKLLRSVLVLSFVVSAFILSIPLWLPINGHDGWIHLNWLEQFTRLFREGDLHPRWMPDSFSGYGSPAFYIYPPLTYWVASVVSFVGIQNSESLYFALVILSMFASISSFYVYAREITLSKQSSLFGGLCYSFAPYVLIDISIRNALSEHVAFVWIPLIFIGLERWIIGDYDRQKRTIGATIYIVATVCLALTNIPVFVITNIATVVYLLTRPSNRSISNRSLHYIVGLIAAILLTAFYYGTAFAVKDQLSTEYLWTILGERSVHRWILAIGDEYQHSRDLFLSLTVVIGSIAIVLTRKFASEYNSFQSVYILALLAIVFQMPYVTDMLYELPILRYIQFDQRWNVILTFATALCISFLYDKRHKIAIVVGSSLLVCAACVPLVVTFFFSNPPSHKVVQTYHNDPPEYINKYVQDTSITYPKYFSRLGVKDLVDDDSLTWKRTGASTYEITKLAEREMDVRFKLQYFPFWWLSEKRMNTVELYPDSSGILHARLPKGKGTYYLSQVVGGSASYELLSLLSLPFVLLCLLISYHKERLSQLLRKVNKFFNKGI